MTIADVKFAIPAVCNGSVASISITDSFRTYSRSPVYGVDSNTRNVPNGMTLRVIFPTPYDRNNGTSLSFTVNLRSTAPAGCNNVRFFFDSPVIPPTAIQYAYYGQRDKLCCGTSSTPFA